MRLIRSIATGSEVLIRMARNKAMAGQSPPKSEGSLEAHDHVADSLVAEAGTKVEVARVGQTPSESRTWSHTSKITKCP